ncbi:hypothetical protein ARMSODRAFT_1023743 [Armillaria solidipes]|uniref:Uncharacterized protein n=1 Tax=Armillaria solidipes TaxID=1076256 RepID=A0A2H3BA01_9AGAR|nr:hypothetical protein ARMSODRAFT_1023743 [Armillaria solidipes]
MVPYDEEFNSFREPTDWIDDDDEYEAEYGDYPGYTGTPDDYQDYYPRAPAYDLPVYPFPLPDSLPHHTRQHGQYHGPRHSRLYAGNGGEAGSSDQVDPEVERRRVATEAAKLRQIADLEKQLNDAEMEHRDLASQWGFPMRPTDKGKQPDRG